MLEESLARRLAASELGEGVGDPLGVNVRNVLHVAIESAPVSGFA